MSAASCAIAVERMAHCQASAATGLPAVTVPAGFADDGMPVGVELLGRPFSEPDLLKLAYAFEQATHHRRLPAMHADWVVNGVELIPETATISGRQR